MEEQRSLLGGKVSLRRLPQSAFPHSYVDLTEGGVLRGPNSLFARVPDAVPRTYLAVVVYKGDGTPRGQHYHDRKAETILVVSGTASMIVRDGAEGGEESIDLQPWDILTMEPEVHHALIPRSDLIALEMAESGGTPDETHKVSL